MHCSQTWTSHPLRRAREKATRNFNWTFSQPLKREAPAAWTKSNLVRILVFVVVRHHTTAAADRRGPAKNTKRDLEPECAHQAIWVYVFFSSTFRSFISSILISMEFVSVTRASERCELSSGLCLFVCTARDDTIFVFLGASSEEWTQSQLWGGEKRERENGARRVIVKCEENKANNQIEK